MTSVKCSVSSCHYWGTNNVCEASEINVRNNFHDGSSMSTGMEIGEIGKNDEAGKSSETMCETFKPAKKDKALKSDSDTEGFRPVF
ncbi:MAG: DUF1540 domain-containing protein [Bacillota bacterium]